MRFEMVHSATRTNDGLIHVQNYVAGMSGQHHVHSQKGYENWLVNIARMSQPVVGAGLCACGLDAGDVREFDGKIWRNEQFAA